MGMTIETKYSVDDVVWVMDGQKPRSLKVKQMQVVIDNWYNNNKQTERYFLSSGNTVFSHHEWYNGSGVFSTKEELLKSL